MADVAAAAPHDRLDRRRGLAPPGAPPGRPRGAGRAGRRRRRPRGRAVAHGRRRRPTRRSCCGPARVAAQRDVAAGPLDARPAGRRGRRRRVGRGAGPTAPSTSSSPCSARATGRSTCSSRSTRRGLLVRLAARVGGGAQPPPAQRLPPLHRRPAPVGGGGQRRRADRPASSAPTCCVLAALFHDLGKGSPGRPHRRRHGAGGDDRPAPRAVRRRRRRCSCGWSSTTSCCPTSRCAATSAIRRRSGWSPTPSATSDTLDLLHALTEADSLATGPSAWGSWKAQLVADLVERTPADARTAPTAADAGPAVPGRGDARRDGRRAARRAGRDETERRRGDSTAPSGSPSCATTARDVRPRRRGAVAARPRRADGVGVLGRAGRPADGGVAVPGRSPPPGGSTGTPVIDDLRRALGRRAGDRGPPGRAGAHVPPAPGRPGGAGRAAVGDVPRRRLRRRRRSSRCGRRTASACCTASPGRSPSVGLDIRHATVQSLGEDVVDTFYVQGANGRLVTDEFHRGEIERAILHAVS